MSLEYIRKVHNVPAKKGAKVKYTGASNEEKILEIVGAKGVRLIAKVIKGSDKGKVWIYHPTWEIEYIDNQEQIL